MKISFVIPTHQSVTWLPHAVQSCFDQIYKNIEIVIVDDCSTDYTGQYLKSLADDKRVKIIQNVKNMGRSHSRNVGNDAATGDVICVLDADDMAQNKRAHWMAEEFKSGAKQFVSGSALVIEADGSVSHELRAQPFKKDEAIAKLQNYIVHSTVAYTKDFAKKYPYRDGDISKLGIDDWDQQIRAALDGVRLDFVPQVVSAYRLLDSGIMRRRDEEEVKKAKQAVIESLKVMA